MVEKWLGRPLWINDPHVQHIISWFLNISIENYGVLEILTLQLLVMPCIVLKCTVWGAIWSPFNACSVVKPNIANLHLLFPKHFDILFNMFLTFQTRPVSIHMTEYWASCTNVSYSISVWLPGIFVDLVTYSYLFMLPALSLKYPLMHELIRCGIELGQPPTLWWCISKATPMQVQSGAVRTRSIVSKVLTIDIPQLAREGEVWGVCCDFNNWFTFCHCYRSVVCNIVRI